MATKEEVLAFLNQFTQKMGVFGIRFLDRAKNNDSLGIIDLPAFKREEEEVKKIEVTDYSEGPIPNTLNDYGDLWVFGRDIRGKEVYIKISIDKENNHTICISFHVAEYPMHYPFKQKGEKR